jgi:hypothetical protein
LYSQVKEIFQVICLVIVFAASPLYVPSSQALAQPGKEVQPLTRVFVDCPECDADHLREELKFVNLVRDRLLADVVAMITSLETGSGGRAFSIQLLGINPRYGDTVVVNVRPDATQTEQRQVIARTLKLSLLPFLRGSDAVSHIDVVYSPPTLAPGATRGASDPWNQWVFRLFGSGSFATDEAFSSKSAEGSLSASHITERIKIEVSAKGNFNRERYRLADGDELVSDRQSWSTRSLAVRSISEHLSAGLTGSVLSSEFQNTRIQVRAMPAIEYDFFPYSQATQRQLIVRYGAGVRATKYNDTTIYQQIAETRPVHELSIVSDIREPWGNVWGSALASQYLHDPGKHRLTTEAGIDWRLLAGLSLNISARYSLIRDQLNIQGTNLSDEERLLRLREVQSGYSISGGVGLTYTFGSVFSNVVNPRFRL